MSEATNKTTAPKTKGAGATAKAVAKGSTEQATETKPDASMKVDSKTEGKQNDGELNKESSGANGAGAELGTNAAGNDDSQNSVAGSDVVINGASDNASSAALGEQFKGAFVVTAKTDTGFWRSGVKFKRLEKTLVLVLGEDESGIDDVEVVGYESSQIVCLSAEKAKRIYNEKNLVVTDIDLDELKTK